MADLVSRLIRRTQSIIGYGRTTTAPNDSGTVQTVQIKRNDASVVDNVTVVFQFGFTSSAPPGSVPTHLSATGDLSNGVVVGTLHQASRLKGLTPGQVAIYDAAGSKIVLTNDGDINVYPSGGKMIVHGDAQVIGQMAATGEVVAMSAAAPIHLSTHRHPSPNGTNIITGPPTPGT